MKTPTSTHWLYALLTLLLLLSIALAALRLVREFHERPVRVQVYYCNPQGCDRAAS